MNWIIDIFTKPKYKVTAIDELILSVLSLIAIIIVIFCFVFIKDFIDELTIKHVEKKRGKKK